MKGKTMQDASHTKREGRWDQLKGKARQAWGNLTDDDLDVAEDNYEEFVGRIKERTGESAEDIQGSTRWRRRHQLIRPPDSVGKPPHRAASARQWGGGPLL